MPADAVLSQDPSAIERPLTIRQAAERLSVSVWYLREQCRLGRLAHIRPSGERGPGRRLFVLPSDLREFQAKHRVAASA